MRFFNTSCLPEGESEIEMRVSKSRVQANSLLVSRNRFRQLTRASVSGSEFVLELRRIRQGARSAAQHVHGFSCMGLFLEHVGQCFVKRLSLRMRGQPVLE